MSENNQELLFRVVRIGLGRDDRRFELRVVGQDGVECLVAATSDGTDMINLRDILNGMPLPLAISVAALREIEFTAGQIAHATDDAGGANYATKHHMRAWARAIVAVAENAIATAWESTNKGGGK